MSSRRQSSTNPPRPERPTFFTDRNLGDEIPDALKGAGQNVVRHDAVFTDTRTRDEVWLRRVGREGWIALSHNKKIQRTVSQRDEAMAAGVTLFFLIGHLPHSRLAANLLATLPGVIEFWETYAAPFTARIYRPDRPSDFGVKPGRVELWMDEAGWIKRLEIEAERRQRG